MAAKPMEPAQAARLLEQWIQFYDMNDKKAWDAEDYPYVKSVCDAMKLAAQALRGKAPSNPGAAKKAAALLEECPEEFEIDEPEAWEPENRAFVRDALEAIRFAAAFMKK
ncbi:hypothetical protein ACHHV8_03255 [Paenibacillus sp. TAB 01]|uniref:hypothetical protein n=1 Tax=Paenibacillus sp. TAB 01 TaxID=3368988 RepID=UPI003752BF67